MRLRLSLRADADIVESYLYGFWTFGRDQAEHYERGLRRALEIIAESPRIARERPEYSPPVRIHHHGQHYIVYRIERDHVLIIRVLRDEVELTRHLRSES